jgi:hypothetical protein
MVDPDVAEIGALGRHLTGISLLIRVAKHEAKRLSEAHQGRSPYATI